MRRRDIAKALALSAGPVVLSREVSAQTCNPPCYPRTAAEVAALVTPVDNTYPPGSPFLDVRRYGADPSGVNDSTSAIQAAIMVATQVVSTAGGLPYSGGIVFIPPGTYKISSTITMRPNVMIWGAGCGDSSQRTSLPRCTILQPTSAFSGSDVIRADPADFGGGVYCVGISLSHFMIDLVNVGGISGLTAIRLNSVSDNPGFRDLRVWNMGASHTALHIGVSANPGALLSDGTIFENLVTLFSSGVTNTGSIVILEDCNEITIRDGKILGGSPAATSIGIQVKCTNIGCQAITVDAVSITGVNSGIEGTATGGGVGPRWVRVQNCTFEGVKYGIYATGIAALRSQFWTVIGNRFISTPSGGVNCTLDFAANCRVIMDDYYVGASNVACTANSGGNEIWAQLAGISDVGTNNCKFGHNASGQMQFSGIQLPPS